MQLISALAGGVIGAESGSAVIYRRGTTTPTTWYSDFEGTGSSTATPTLDSTGAAVVYVNELVTVNVMTSAGVLLKSFVAGSDSPNVEVKSLSFEGTNYETAVVAAGNPTTLQATLDKWLTSAGTTDFNVLVGGADKTLQAIAAGFDGIVYNVKDAVYGAVGDGSTDDSVAIQAAVDAAIAAGGGTVFFPPGDYYVATAIDTGDATSGVVANLLGSGSSVTSITGLSSLAKIITVNLGTSGNVVSWSGIEIKHSAAATTEIVDLAGTTYTFRAHDVIFGDSSSTYLSTAQVFNAGTGITCDIDRCKFYYGAIVSGRGATVGVSSIVTNSNFYSTGAISVPLLLAQQFSRVIGNIFAPASGAASTALLEIGGAAFDRSLVAANIFEGTTNAESAVLLAANTTQAAVVANLANDVDATVDCSTNAPGVLVAPDPTRQQQHETTALNGQIFTVNPNITSYCHVELTNAAAVTLQMNLDLTLLPPIGTRVTVSVKTSGANCVVTWDNSTFAFGPGTTTISANSYWAVDYVLVAGANATTPGGWLRVGYETGTVGYS